MEEPETPGGATRYLVDGRAVACVIWHDNGHPDWWWQLDAEGRRHGLERYCHEDGITKWETRHVHGLQHGRQREWDRDGRLVCETRFVRGTGRDLWWGSGRWLSELREYVDGQLHGLEQWWDSARTVYRETRWFRGLEHGIRREWEVDRLRAGFPQFFVNGARVSRAVYARTAISDPTLPPIVAAEDRRTRRPQMPPRGLAEPL